MKLLIISESFNDKYFAIINDIITREKNSDSTTNGVILDICGYLHPLINLSSENSLGRTFNPYYSKYRSFVRDFFGNLEFSFHTLERQSKLFENYDKSTLTQIIDESGTTTLATLFSKSKQFHEYPRKRRMKLETIIKGLYSEYIELLSNKSFDRIYIPSGKNAWAIALEKAILLHSPGSEVFYYDAFGSSETYFCENYKPTDLLALQKAIVKRKDLTDEQIIVATDWFYKQAKSKLQNFYLSSDDFKEDKTGKKLSYTLFTSSEDEFVGLPKWSESAFDSQYEGLYLAAKFLLEKDPRNTEVTLRYHPHLKYKSLTDNFKALFSAIKFKQLGCTIVLANERISATSLIEKSDKVVVWNSTVGIESCFMGKQTYHLANAIYAPLRTAMFVKEIQDLDQIVESHESQRASLLYGYFMATTSFPITTFDFYHGRRFESRYHYLLYGNHRAIRSRLKLMFNNLILSVFRFIFLRKLI
jgi:hypothetical protein